MPLPRPDRSLGQHFLTDLRVVERTLGYAALAGDETVLEIGPGPGVLTRALSAALPRGRVHALDIDPRMVEAVRALDLPNVDVRQADAVEDPWPAFDACVSNLPYNVSTPIMFRLLDAGRPCVVMLQKEFADRLGAKVGSDDYSRLTVETFWRADAKILERVPPGAFVPPPKVESALVRLTPRPAPFSVDDEEIFHAVVEAAFSERRKKLANGLSSARRLLPGRVRNADFAALPHADDRPERVPPAGFAKVADALTRGGRGGA